MKSYRAFGNLFAVLKYALMLVMTIQGRVVLGCLFLVSPENCQY